MFSVNDHVVFGNHGICVIKAIGPLDLSIAERGRLYYTLEPLYAQKNTIYTPVDNEKSSLRRAITREDALELIDRIENPSPGTGDNSRLFLWFILTLLSGGAALTLAARGRRKKNL